MKKVMVVGCWAYMDSGYGCPGEWRCLKAAALGEGTFVEPVQVISFVKCKCPGRSLAANVGMAITWAEIKPDAIYLSSCWPRPNPTAPTAAPTNMPNSSRARRGSRSPWAPMTTTDHSGAATPCGLIIQTGPVPSAAKGRRTVTTVP